jgi:D-sedoheptulose 7-phosphate isomerase
LAKPKVEQRSTSSRVLQDKISGDSWKASLVLKEIQDSIEAKEKLAGQCVEDILVVADAITTTLREGGKVVFFGNGGSAGDAQHLAAEFVGRFAADRPPLRGIAFTTNTSVLTAVGNDFGFEEVFSRQVAALVDSGDVVVGISTSGRSKNVINGVREARRLGAKTVALTGSSGGELAGLCDYHVMVPSTNTQRIQECHIMIGHILCGLVETSLTASDTKHGHLASR